MEPRLMTISVVIPAYNSAAHIARAIDSVLAQTHPADEIIVVDDGSTDNTAQIIQGYGSRVRLIQQSNAGAAGARNTGITAAACEWVAFLDADDEWLANRLAAQTAILQQYPDLVWVTGNYITCSCDENRQAAYIVPAQAIKILKGGSIAEDYLAMFDRGLCGHTDTMLIRRAVLLEAGLSRVGQHKANDIDLWWRIAYRYPTVGYTTEPIAIYHLAVAGSISKATTGSTHYIELISRHLTLAQHHHRLNTFRPLAAHLLRGWMRSMLFTAQAEDIRLILKEFHSLLPAWYRLWMRLLTAFPNLTAAACHLISKIVRCLKLRRRVVLPPLQKR